ncbi:MAG: secretin and TonB N-terminal domain-containing protein [Planctomycetes bacterium]|nr:secretin and TonB N-terminal domain-containing protein [Planctomycetota bacterium]
MDRKRRILGFILLFLFGLTWTNPARLNSGQSVQEQPVQAATEAQKKTEIQNPWPIIRTYTLKHVKPEAVFGVAKLFLVDFSAFGSTITVKLYEQDRPKFEELLKQLDVEKKMVQFQAFAIVASREHEEEKKMAEIGEQAAAIAASAALKPSYAQPKDPTEKPRYAGEPISLKFKESDLRDVILYIAQAARLNVVFDPDVRGIVTCNLEDVPWDQALDIVLKQNNMGKSIEGNFLRIARTKTVRREPGPGQGAAIENKDLKKVLDELKALWNFRSYEVDGPSFLTVHEDSGPDNFKLVTDRALNLVISNVKVRGDEPGKRTISIEQLKLTGMTNFVDYVFIDTHDVTLKEKGYLVAGVSGYGSASNALILVINAEIK